MYRLRAVLLACILAVVLAGGIAQADEATIHKSYLPLAFRPQGRPFPQAFWGYLYVVIPHDIYVMEFRINDGNPATPDFTSYLNVWSEQSDKVYYQAFLPAGYNWDIRVVDRPFCGTKTNISLAAGQWKQENFVCGLRDAPAPPLLPQAVRP